MNARTHFIAGILMLICVRALCGTYYVEVPENLTDEMMLNQTGDISLVFA